MKRFVFRPYALIAMAVAVVFASAMGMDSFGLIFVGWFVLNVAMVLCCLWPARWGGGPLWLRSWITIPLSLALMVSVVWAQWPLRLEFKMVRPTIDSIAAQVDRGQTVRTPIQLGLLRLRKVEKYDGEVRLWVLDGDDGFVRTSPEGVRRYAPLATVHLDKDWQYIAMD